MEDLSKFCCQNADCSEYGKRNNGNLTVCDHYGKDDAIKMLRCSICKSRFSERKGTIYFNSSLTDNKIEEIINHVREGTGIRGTSRLMKVSTDTVIRYVRLGGSHAQNMHNELVAISPRDKGSAAG